MISKITIIYIALTYLAVINIFALIMTYADKRKAVNNKWRISEKALLLTAFLGGSLFEYLTMILIHHKTRHPKFMIGLPLIMFLQIVLIVFLSYKLILC